jgi:hypothetical protein
MLIALFAVRLQFLWPRSPSQPSRLRMPLTDYGMTRHTERFAWLFKDSALEGPEVNSSALTSDIGKAKRRARSAGPRQSFSVPVGDACGV